VLILYCSLCHSIDSSLIFLVFAAGKYPAIMVTYREAFYSDFVIKINTYLETSAMSNQAGSENNNKSFFYTHP